MAEAESFSAGPAGLLNPVPAQHARLLLAQGDVTRAARWADDCGLAPGDPPDYPREPGHLVLARLLLARDRADLAVALLDRLEEAAAGQNRAGSLIEIRACRALALHALGDETGATAALTAALEIGCPQGYVRVFADEGPAMAAVLGRLIAAQHRDRQAARIPLACLARLQRAFDHGRGTAGVADVDSRALRLVEQLTSRGDGRIGRIDPAGAVSSVPVLTPAGSPYGLCAGPERTLWYTLLAADRVGRIGLDGGIEEFPLPAGSMPSLITAGPDGALWCTLNQAGAIGRITPSGDLTAYPLPTAGAAPVGIHAGDEAVWFAEISAGQIGRISPDGRIEEYPLPDRSCRPHAIAATTDGGCWATLWAASSVVRLDRDGCLAEEISFQPGSEPHGIAAGPEGSVWVALEAGSLAHLTR